MRDQVYTHHAHFALDVNGNLILHRERIRDQRLNGALTGLFLGLFTGIFIGLLWIFQGWLLHRERIRDQCLNRASFSF